MLRIAISALLFSLASCSTTHDIQIPKKPCLIPDRKFEFNLCRDFKFTVDGKKYSVPQEFDTDLASVPRILWSVYSPNQTETIPGAIIHDYLYSCPAGMPRSKTDSILYDALVYHGVSKYTAFKYWFAVRLFGSKHFKEGARCFYVKN